MVLASNVSNIQEFILAKNVIFKMIKDIKEGVLTVTKTIRAIFVGAHKKAIQRRDRHNINESSRARKCASSTFIQLAN